MIKQTVLLDSNIIVDGILSKWSASKALLILARETQFFNICMAQTSVEEIEDIFERKGLKEAKEDLQKYLKYTGFKVLLLPTKDEIKKNKDKLLPLVRHISDLPIVVTAINNNVDWIVSNNRVHFNDKLATAIKIKIVSSQEFLKKFELMPE